MHTQSLGAGFWIALALLACTNAEDDAQGSGGGGGSGGLATGGSSWSGGGSSGSGSGASAGSTSGGSGGWNAGGAAGSSSGGSAGSGFGGSGGVANLHPNLPSGYTLLGERYFEQRYTVNGGTPGIEGGFWDDAAHVYPDVVDVASLDVLPGESFQPAGVGASVGRVFYKAGFANWGTSPGQMSKHVDPGGTTSIYIAWQFALSTNWFGHSNGVKIWLPGTGSLAQSKHAMVVHLRGFGSGAQRWDAVVSAGVKNLGGNNANGDRMILGSVQNAMPRGAWRSCELLYTLNTAGQADGVIKLWMDGQPILSATNVAVRGANPGDANTGPNDEIVRLEWTPTYGGGANKDPSGNTTPVPAPGSSMYMGYAGLWKL